MEEQPALIPFTAKQQTAAASILVFSSAAVWEMAIKVRLNKLLLKSPLHLFVADFQITCKAELLDVTLSHIYHTQQLPLHHKDPFDRLLIAQALVENLPVVSSDAVWDAYGVHRIWN